MIETTLQINLSPGDVRYAAMTVPELVRTHRNEVSEVLLVVDCCRPQRTKIVDPELRFPRDEFHRGVDRITALAHELCRNGIVDRIELLMPESPLLQHIFHRYLGGVVHETHDYGGCALASYFAAFELVTTPFLLHYDADMLLHQRPGYSWLEHGRELLETFPQLLSVTPALAPSRDPRARTTCNGSSIAEAPTAHDDWFSTRCFLCDRRRVERLLPLPRGRLLLELLLVRFLRRGYPRSPEVMLHRRMKAAGFYRGVLPATKAWLLHPKLKGDSFISLLPEILMHVRAGQCPETQYDDSEFRFADWAEFCKRHSSTVQQA